MILGGMKMSKFDSYESYMLNNLEQAQKRIEMYQDEMYEAAKRIKSLECDIANKDLVIKNQEKTIDSLKEKLKKTCLDTMST